MERKEIENRQQELIKKFREIIDKKEKKSAAKPFPFLLILLLTILIAGGLVILRPEPETLSPKDSHPSPQASPAPVPNELPASTVENRDVDTSDTAPDPIQSARKPVEQQTAEQEPESVPVNPVIEQNVLAEPSGPDLQKEPLPGVQIAEMVSCSSIKNKQYINPRNQFSLAQDAAVKVWMKVISENPSFTLTHVYFINGQKYCEVPLAIRYHRMRTWSSVNLASADHIGRWRVEVITENGVKLDQVEFAVVK